MPALLALYSLAVTVMLAPAQSMVGIFLVPTLPGLHMSKDALLHGAKATEHQKTTFIALLYCFVIATGGFKVCPLPAACPRQQQTEGFHAGFSSTLRPNTLL